MTLAFLADATAKTVIAVPSISSEEIE